MAEKRKAREKGAEASLEFTAEQIAEWVSFGPGKPPGKPPFAPEAVAASSAAKPLRKAFAEKIAKEIGGKFKKVEKALDIAAGAAEEKTALNALRPAYLDPPSGTRDFYPEDLRLQKWLFGHMREVARQFDFQEYDAPVLEHTELYKKKAAHGEEIVEQMYAFTDKEGDSVTLRPEMTPTLARMVLNKVQGSTGKFSGGTLPLKWFSIPQCWRFETCQRGRKREHYQWNMDIVGAPDVTAELELLAAAAGFFQRLGIGPDAVGIKVNSRRVLESVLTQAGVIPPNAMADKASRKFFEAVCVIIDKLDKIGPEEVKKALAEAGVPGASADKILEAMKACTVEDLEKVLGGTSDAIDEMKRLFEMARGYGISDYLQFDASVVRGLSYYTGVVFEAFDKRGELRAIMGGGRYDKLLALYSDEKCKISCCGFGFGDCVIVELLKELKLLPDFTPTVDYVVAPWSPELYGAAAGIARQLRENGNTVDLMVIPKKNVTKAFDYANSKNAHRIAFVAPKELEEGKVRIKGLREKDAAGEPVQVDVPLDALDTINALMEAAGGSGSAQAAWTSAEVGTWLDSVGLSQHKATFATNKIVGADLVDLCQDDLVSMEIEPAHERKLILRNVKALF